MEAAGGKDVWSEWGENLPKTDISVISIIDSGFLKRLDHKFTEEHVKMDDIVLKVKDLTFVFRIINSEVKLVIEYTDY